MTNCEKCGNPLQPGLTACPICGTTAKSIDAPAAPVMQPAVETIGAATVANPVPQAQPAAPVIEPGPIAAPAPVPAPAPVMEAPAPVPAPVPAPAPVTPAPVMEAPVAAPAPAPVPTPVPAAPVVAEPAVAPAPVAEVPAPVPAPAPIMEAPAPVPAPAPAIEPLPAQGFSGAEVAAPVAPTPVADTPIPAPAVSNTIPAPAPAAPIAPAAPVEDKKGKKKKQKGNTGLVILVAIVALGLGLGAGYLLSPSLKAAPVPTTPAEEVSTAQPVSLNGFSFAVEEGWQYSQLGDKVIINNEDEAVLARLAVYDGVFENMNTTSIELSLSTKEGYSDIEVEKTTLGERDVIIVSAVNGESSVQYYYFAHTTEEVLSVTVIYAKSADKKTYEETVKALVEGTTYNDDAVNAIEAISPYSTLFDDSKSVYDSSFNDQKTNTEEQATGEQPETQNGEQTEPVTEEVVS